MATDRDALSLYGPWERAAGLFGSDRGVRASSTMTTVRLRVALARRRGQMSYRAELSPSAKAFLACLNGGTTTDEEIR